jgi:sortase (surface protein transpeptidase)
MTAEAPRHRRPAVPRASRTSPSAPSATLLLAALFTGACGAFAWTTGVHLSSPPPRAPSPVALSAPLPGRSIERSVPARIDIPAIGVAADVESLDLNSDGTLATPQNWNDAGWYSKGVTPGDPGPAVIVGHRDSAADGAAVFFRLGELSPGTLVTVTESDGNTNTFAVESLDRVAKSDFPTEEVYGPSAHRLLRLITCTGAFDYAARSYVDDLVVTARAV